MAVTLSDIVMDFPGTRALDHVTVEFRFDEVHGLVGENGAGKSTFVNVLGGTLRPSSGRIAIEGREVTLGGPRDALDHGIAHVSQEGSLVPGLTGAENIMLGAEPRLAGLMLDKRRLAAEAARLLDTWFPGVSIALDRPVIDLPMAERKVIEIIRALRGDIRLLILDEPTATLEAREKGQLWAIIRSLPERGVGVVLISHFLSEIVELSDRITVLRDGEHAGTVLRGESNETRLTELMLRRDVALGAASAGRVSDVADGPVVIEIEDWRVGDVDVPRMSMRAGEIVGLIGLTGAGHFGLARSIYTPKGVTSGRIAIDGTPVANKDIRAMQQAGVALVPDHRMENALAGDASVVENMSLVHSNYAAKGGILSRRREREEASRIIELLNVKTPSQRQLIRNLSGGNKQKVSIGKWLYGARDRYRVLIFIEPTEGVDIGAKREIYDHMRHLAKGGAVIVIASSDLGEIAEVCHRAVPFIHGRPGPGIPADAFSESRFIAAISGDAA